MADRRRLGRHDETAHGRDPHAAAPAGDAASDLTQLDPFGGSVADSGPLWSRRQRRHRRETGWVDPARHVGEPSEAPVQPSPLRARATAARRHFLPLPIENIDRHLGAGEEVLHDDRPALAWFLVNKLQWVLGLAVLVAAVLVCLLKGWGWPGVAFAVLAAGVVGGLFVLRLDDRYTAYIITNARMIRMSGVLRSDVESIPWVRVTDVHFEQSFLERLLGYATLHIQSANENTGLRQMAGIDDFESFTHHLTDMIVAKQGATQPLGRRSDYAITPANRGLVAFRRRQQEERLGSGLAAGGDEAVVRPARTTGPATGSAPATGPLTGPPGGLAGAAAAAAAATGGAAPGATGPARPAVPRVRVAEPEPDPDLGPGPVTTARMSIPGRLRRSKPDDDTPMPDPALPQDLSDMSRVSRDEMAADRIRQDDLLGRTSPAADEPGGRDDPRR